MAESRKKKVAKESEAPKKKPAAPRKKKEVKVEKVEAVQPVKAAPAPEQAAAPAPAPTVHHHVHHAAKPKKVKAAGPKYYGTGRRKEAVAKVWLTPGSGKITVNGLPYSQYFCNRKVLEYYVNRPLVATQNTGKFDVTAQVFGGGVPGQATAVSLGIARALVQVNADLKTPLKRQGLMTRDPRMKERKKYGRKRARRAFQYTKR